MDPGFQISTVDHHFILPSISFSSFPPRTVGYSLSSRSLGSSDISQLPHGEKKNLRKDFNNLGSSPE
ncbi:hypothetical protein VTH06DRAFT_272 [Thermothelomyces fergusii]